MFGISSFAQVPFASLAGTAHTASLTEDIGLADTNTQVWSFQQSQTEAITIDDFNSEAGILSVRLLKTSVWMIAQHRRAHSDKLLLKI